MPDLMTSFELVWKAYPRRVGKGRARRLWARLQPTPALVDKILAAIQWQREQPNWRKDGGMWVPHFSTWLHQERWTDEPFETPRPKMNGQDAREIQQAADWRRLTPEAKTALLRGDA